MLARADQRRVLQEEGGLSSGRSEARERAWTLECDCSFVPFLSHLYFSSSSVEVRDEHRRASAERARASCRAREEDRAGRRRLAESWRSQMRIALGMWDEERFFASSLQAEGVVGACHRASERCRPWKGARPDVGRNTTLYFAPHVGSGTEAVQATHWWFSGKIGHCQLLLNCLAPGSIPGQCRFASPANWPRAALRAVLVFCSTRRTIAKRCAGAASGRGHSDEVKPCLAVPAQLSPSPLASSAPLRFRACSVRSKMTANYTGGGLVGRRKAKRRVCVLISLSLAPSLPDPRTRMRAADKISRATLHTPPPPGRPIKPAPARFSPTSRRCTTSAAAGRASRSRARRSTLPSSATRKTTAA